MLLFVSVCLFFNFSRSFVNWFLHFLHFVFKVFDHLYYHYFELFSGSLPISSSFIWTSVFPSLLFHLCSISLPFHYYYYYCFTYCFWGLLFPGFKVKFFLPFGFCPYKVGPVVCVSFTQGWDLCWVFVCLFFLWWARLSEVVIQSADDLVCIFVLYVIKWGILHRRLLVAGWCQILYSGGFLCVSSH